MRTKLPIVMPGQMFPAYLAEDYDGIGQYTLVALSRASTAAALRARVASGDFGGSRVIPAGTKVHAFSNHGKIEVFLGNLPKDRLCWKDTFVRTGFEGFNAGWGPPTSDPTNVWITEAYNPEGVIDAHVDNGFGFISAGSGDNEARLFISPFPGESVAWNTLYINGTSYYNPTFRISFSGLFTWFNDYNSGGRNAFAVTMDPDGNLGIGPVTAPLSLPLNADGSISWRLRILVQANTIAIRIWGEGTPEPTEWLLSGDAAFSMQLEDIIIFTSGGAAAGGGGGGGGGGGIGSPQSVITDTCSRFVPAFDGWGISDSGYEWNQGAGLNGSVAGGICTWSPGIAGAGGTGATIPIEITAYPFPIEILTYGSFADTADCDAGDSLRFTLSNYARLALLLGGTTAEVSSGLNVDTIDLAVEFGSWTWEQDIGIRIKLDGTNVYAKIWPTSQAEPTNYQVQVAADPGAPSGILGFSSTTSTASALGDPWVWNMDSFDVLVLSGADGVDDLTNCWEDTFDNRTLSNDVGSAPDSTPWTGGTGDYDVNNGGSGALEMESVVGDEAAGGGIFATVPSELLDLAFYYYSFILRCNSAFMGPAPSGGAMRIALGPITAYMFSDAVWISERETGDFLAPSTHTNRVEFPGIDTSNPFQIEVMVGNGGKFVKVWNSNQPKPSDYGQIPSADETLTAIYHAYTSWIQSDDDNYVPGFIYLLNYKLCGSTTDATVVPEDESNYIRHYFDGFYLNCSGSELPPPIVFTEPPPPPPPGDPPGNDPPPPSSNPPPVIPPPPTPGQTLTVIKGFGRNTVGGSGQPFYHVTHLGNSGAGSFRDAVSQGNRYIVFDLAGTIDHSERVDIGGNYITVDGASAPSPGITLTGHHTYIRDHHDIIFTSFRHHGGWAGGQDADCLTTVNSYNIVYDHMSISGFYDEGIDMWIGCYDCTIQWCFISPGNDPSHNFGSLCGGGKRITYHHNLFYKLNYRQPAVGFDVEEPATGATPSEITADVVNNLIWKYTGFGTTIYRNSWANVVANYYSRDASAPSGGEALDVGLGGLCYAASNVSQDGESLGGNRSTPFAVALSAEVSPTTACVAANAVKNNAGCFPRDSGDNSRIAAISLTC